jgi:phosphoglycerol transferase
VIKNKFSKAFLMTALLVGIPLVLAIYIFGVGQWDFSVPLPLSYDHFDGVWQLVLTKSLVDNHWVFVNPYLGAPGVADWHYHPAAQSSALHSVLMLAISLFVDDAVRVQQIYYFANFPLICCTSYIACRLLGIKRVPAFCVGLLYAFTGYRLNTYIYAYLANYFMIPLALTPVIWVMSGRFFQLSESLRSVGLRQQLCELAKTREFMLGLIFAMLMAASDGYYAFFTLLLFGFSVVARLLLGDWRRPISFAPGLVYIVAMVVVALSLQLPMMLYKHAHRSEFYPNGVADPALVRHPFEAEVYSDTLKLMLTPPQNHRLEAVRSLATKVVATAGAAMKYPHPAAIPLGTIATCLFISALLLLAVPGAIRNRVVSGTSGYLLRLEYPQSLTNALLSLAIFIFLCSIVGGIGTIIALFYPSIRAYQRFPLFLIFILYVWGAHILGSCLADGRARTRRVCLIISVAITFLGLLDQIPVDVRRDKREVEHQFLAERAFVHQVEKNLPDGSMVYQYPYSQYLSDNKYYGWGAFYHLRLYLHSHHLRWSNGGAKNSPADEWNARISQLPLEAQIVEIEAAGFGALVIDGVVLDAATDDEVKAGLVGAGYAVSTDQSSKLSYVKLHDPGYKIVFNSLFDQVNYIRIKNRARFLAQDRFSVYVNGPALRAYVASSVNKTDFIIKRSDHPQLFYDGAVALRGLGSVRISAESMKGSLTCELEHEPSGSSGSVNLTLKNSGEYDWEMDGGAYPIRIGALVKNVDDTILWDGFRVKSPGTYVRRGASQVFHVPLDQVMDAGHDLRAAKKVDFVLVQDANTWYFNISCSVPVSGA